MNYGGLHSEGMTETDKLVTNVNSIGQYLHSEINGEYGKMSPRLRKSFVGTLTQARKSLNTDLTNYKMLGVSQAGITKAALKGGHDIVEVMRKINGLLSLLEEI